MLGSLVLIHPDNMVYLKNIDIFGGTMANIGEAQMSRLINMCYLTLESVIYCPARTKNGGLVRPGYDQGKRDDKLTFNQLTELVMNLFLFENDTELWSHVKFGWITPNLERLVYRIDSEEKLPKSFEAFKPLFDLHPKLEKIEFVVYLLSNAYTKLNLVAPYKVLSK